MSIVKEYEFNSAVFVLYDVIYALEGTLVRDVPKEVQNEFKKLLKILENNLPYDPVLHGRDIENSEYIKRVTYADEE